MLSGEYSFELKDMGSLQIIFCLFFVIISFILFNLIVGISFENIEKIMSESRQLNVLDKIRKLIEMGEKFQFFEEWIKKRNSAWLEGIFVFFVEKYKHVQYMSKVYVEMSTMKVFVRINGERQKILKDSDNNTAKSYTMDDETFESIQNIEEERKKSQSMVKYDTAGCSKELGETLSAQINAVFNQIQRSSIRSRPLSKM